MPDRPTGAATEVPIRGASSVMLVRDGSRGVEVFTLQRVSRMVFAAGMTVFPGGGVDERDADADIGWLGPDPEWWAQQWGVAAVAARSHVVAAIRELFEETGVLLAGPDSAIAASAEGGSGTGATAMPSRSNHAAIAGPADREAVTAHRASLAAVLRGSGARLRSDLLRPWARWITPPGPPRRYDTFFFLAALPDGQQADHATTEAAAGGWYRPRDVLDAGLRGEVGLMPPTLAMLSDLADAGSVDQLLDTPRQVHPVTPEVLTDDGEVLRVRVGDESYETRMPRIP